jgi:DNA-directed RNA polymerase subunit RPC12/RpoP
MGVVPGRSTRSLGVMVEARYVCRRCEKRFSKFDTAIDQTHQPANCPECGESAKFLEWFDPSGHEPPRWGPFSALDVLLWGAIALLALLGGGAALVCK